MAKVIEVTTESGAKYILNTELKMMRRVRPAEINLPPGVGLSLIKGDGQDHPYDKIHSPLEVGNCLYVTWFDGRKPCFRQSTRITAVKEIDVPSAPDQPA